MRFSLSGEDNHGDPPEILNNPDGVSASTHRVRIPGFLLEEDVGLGDVVKHVTYAMGVKPCGGCERRATLLNRWVVFTRK
jgi:hypothetical protein